MIFNPIFEKGGLPLSEYPRPQFKRKSYLSLNGLWEYKIFKGEEPAEYDGKIVVPYSPECDLSGVNRQLQKDETLVYRRYFTLPNGFNEGLVLLNVGACDQVTTVYLNGVKVGENFGGYLPFTIDLTNNLIDGENELKFTVVDDASSDIYGRGKQTYKNGGIWYLATSGIWQSVFLESVPNNYIKSVKLTPDFDSKTLLIKPEKVGNLPFKAEVYNGNELIVFGEGENEITLDVSLCKPWSPSSPELYTVILTMGSDRVESYFGLRKFSLIEKNGYKVFAVNNEPIFHNGLLDQGYYYQGMLTPKTNETMYNEIKAVKDLGYNMLRKHIKVEPLLWYYYCDILGVLVWQDMINGGAKYKKFRIYLAPFINLHINDKNFKGMGRSEASRKQYMIEALGLQQTLYNVVSLCLYTPFNEAWGQFDALNVTKILQDNDPTRLYDHASGWQDKGGGDVNSKHIYFRKIRLKSDKKRALAVTEFGGYSLAIKGHESSAKKFGYKIFKTKQELTKAYLKLYETEIIPEIYKNGLSATVYTELTDIEDEMNGIFTFDRVLKIDANSLITINEKVEKAFEEKFKN